MAALAMLCRAGLGGASCARPPTPPGWGAPLLGCPAAKAAEKAEVHLVAAKPACLNAAETREMVKSRHLLEPFAGAVVRGR